MPVRYPPARVDPLVEVLHGVAVADPYRWLEDDGSPETRAWVDAQNALTRSMLDGPARDALVEELTRRFDYPRTVAAYRRRDVYFFSHNPGLLNQPVLYVRRGWSGAPRVLLDPNRLSGDGTTALTAIAASPDGSLIAYAISEHGSDRQTIRVRRVEDGADLDDRLAWVKFASIAWTADNTGFYYLRFPEPGSVPPEDEQYFGRIFFHRCGDAQAADALVFEKPEEKEIVPLVHVSDDDRYAVIVAQRGASDDSEVYLIDRRVDAAPRALFRGFDAAYDFIESAGGLLYFRTTRDAPMGRVVSVDPSHPAPLLREVVPEGPHRLSSVAMAAGSLVAVFLENASDRIVRFALDGSRLGAIELPEIGTVVTLDAHTDRDEIVVTFASFTTPPCAFRSAGSSGLEAADPLPRDVPPKGGSDLRLPSQAYRTTQVWYESKDGTPVSMFLVHRAGLPRDGERPVLLSGYGGFNINRTPAYDPGNFPLLDRGGIFALANLRGGGEYGEAWHRAGMLECKQNVFDDFIAAAEYLIGERYTRPDLLAIEGGSNGGLLVGAVMTQRPELFGAVLCRVPVADMLRYHRFTVGRFWIPEYGCADDPDQFPYLLRYSPYHNVREGVAYPRTMIMTADTDDRVAPGMAKKFAARLQAAGGGGPVLLRVETRAGHGAGKPIAKVIEEEADMLAFLGVGALRMP
ncbi:MAG TPA: prolyl oligopeptidase family serine peptidase [Vicinamibacterales bacterium]|nr:prolyl oligopeptidase family serine peptidase [Vicinamibacterales bacterium]